MTETLINLVSVQLGGKTVVDRVSASLTPGKLHILVGPNGAGKSTLLKAMVALLPLSTGSVSLNGLDAARLSPAKRADMVAYLPQDRSIAWDLSAVDVAALGAYHLAPEVARQRAFEALRGLGLENVAERGVFGLSGGQRTRVLLARLLVSPAKTYALDEPLTALDPAWQRQVLFYLKQRAEAGYTIILSLHDLQLAAQFADEVLVMHQGAMVQMGIPEAVFTPRILRDVFNLSGHLAHENGHRVLHLGTKPQF